MKTCPQVLVHTLQGNLQLRALNKRMEKGFWGRGVYGSSIIHWLGYLLVQGCKCSFIIFAEMDKAVCKGRRRNEENQRRVQDG